MQKDSEELTFFLTGYNKDFLNECILEIKEEYKLNLNAQIINDINYTKEDYCNCYYDSINEASYFNIFILDYSTKEEIIDFFKEFNKNYKKTYIKFDSYPFFLINEKIYDKKQLIKDIKELINENRPSEYHIQSKDILIFTNKFSLKNQIIKIYKYYTENEDLFNQTEEDKALNILLCGIKGVGKTFLMNKLLFENRGLSKDNNHTTKLNKYRHKLYPINFYDIPGFGQNEDSEMANAKSYISQFNTQYEKIKNKIHIIFYLFNCDSARLLQDKEVELIENFLTYNIPIYFIGNKSNFQDEKTFKRGILFNLKQIKSNLSSEYFKSHIFCINDKNETIYVLLSKISEELENSKKAHINIIEEYENNNYIRDSINEYYSEPKEENDNNNNNNNNNILQKKILKEMKNSIFFNDLSSSLTKIQEKVLEITETIKKESWAFIPFKSIEKDLSNLSNQIEKEYKKLINENDIKKIEQIIERYSEKNDLKDNKIIDYTYTSSLTSSLLIIPFIACNLLSPLFLIIPAYGTIAIISRILYKKFNNQKIISKFSTEINNKILKRITLYDIISIKLNAEKFNEIIEKFNEYLKHFQTENENDIDLLENN